MCVCVFAISARISCSFATKLAVAAGGAGGQVIAVIRVIRYRPMFEFKLIITVLSCSSNMGVGTIITRVGLSPIGLKWGGGGVSPP